MSHKVYISVAMTNDDGSQAARAKAARDRLEAAGFTVLDPTKNQLSGEAKRNTLVARKEMQGFVRRANADLVSADAVVLLFPPEGIFSWDTAAESGWAWDNFIPIVILSDDPYARVYDRIPPFLGAMVEVNNYRSPLVFRDDGVVEAVEMAIGLAEPIEADGD